MLNLKNRFIMAPVKLGYSDGTGVVTERHLKFYERRNRNIGAIIPEPFYMDAGLRELPAQMGADDDKKLAGLSRLTVTIHQHGAKAFAHLNHPGRMANPRLPGNYFWSSTGNACENGGAVPQIMDRTMMDRVVQLFVSSAERVVKAGFDGIELQLGHGYLLAQFLSPGVNDRTDAYGGSMENRFRFPLEVVQAVMGAVDVPVIIRISGDEMVPDGIHLDEMIQLSLKLEGLGVAAIHVSAGSACSTPPWFFQHMFVPKGKTWELAGGIKGKVHIPVIFVGQINTAEDIDHLIREYGAEYLAMGRSLVADPDFPGKYLHQVSGIIRPCLACAEGCLGGVKSGAGLGCVVNYELGKDYQPLTGAEKKGHYAVIGGGLAGMQAAITLNERGHQVDLFEKDKLGGQFNLAYLPPKKGSLKRLVTYYEEALRSHHINVIHKEAQAADVTTPAYDGVIMATGAVPAVPPIRGLHEFYWTEFLDDEQLPRDQKVLVIGGGLIGIEVASKLVDAGNQVIIVEMLEEIARGMEMIEKAMTLKKLEARETEIFLGHKVVEVNEDRVIITGKEGQKTLTGIDKIVIAAGMKSNVPFEKAGSVPVYFTGDAEHVGKAQDAIQGAYKLAGNL